MRIFYLLLFIFWFSISIAQAQDAGRGKVSGTIKEKGTNEPLVGAAIRLDGTTLGAATDLDGKFTVNAPVGTYAVVITMVGYNTRRVEGVVVRDKETTIIPEAFLEETANETETVELVSTIKRGSQEAIFAEMRSMTVVSSGMSSDQIRRTPDRTTAEALRRVSGASIQEGRFAIVRGLADRYNLGLINGSIFPSTESDRKAFSLELIPANVLESIMILKTATPDMPGDWAGGIIAIRTRDIPFEDQIRVTVGMGSQSRTTFKDYYRSPQGGTDYLGIDDGKRALPNIGSTAEVGQRYGQNGRAGGAELARQFTHRYTPETGNAPVDQTLNLAASKRFKLFGNDFGVVFGGTYQRRFRYLPFFSTRPNIDQQNQTAVENPIDGDTIRSNNYRTITTVGSILNLTYKLGNYSKLGFKNFYSINTDDQVVMRTINNRRNLDGIGVDTRNQQELLMLYKQDRLYAPQFTGEHILNPQGSNIRIDYTLGYNDILRQVPDYRMLAYRTQYVADGGYTTSGVAVSDGASAFENTNNFRYFSTLTERAYQTSFNVAVPLDRYISLSKSELKVGGMYHTRSRQFNSRNFAYVGSNSLNDSLLNLPANVIYNPENLAANRYGMVETTRGSDRYKAYSQLRAAYAMLDLNPTSRLHLVGGVRAESYLQRVYDTEFATNIRVDTTLFNLLPSVNAIYALTEKSNLRASFSKSVNRPEFRELAPAVFYEFNFNALQFGDPRLKTANVYNFDLKYEIFPTDGAMFSINPFFKRFINPIELFVESNPNFILYSYRNSRSAEVTGIEFETRLTGQMLGAKGFLSNFALFANYSYMNSMAQLGPKAETNYAYDRRQLQGQSPYLINAGLQYTDTEREFDANLTINRTGRRLYFVSATERDLFWENPRTVIDFSVTKTFARRLQVRAVLGDILAQDLVIYKDLNLNKKYDKGSDVTSFRYSYGFTTQLNLTYQF